PGKSLTSEYIAHACQKFRLSQFFPSRPSNRETGSKRGCVVLATDTEVVSTLAGIASLRCGDRWVNSKLNSLQPEMSAAERTPIASVEQAAANLPREQPKKVRVAAASTADLEMV